MCHFCTYVKIDRRHSSDGAVDTGIPAAIILVGGNGVIDVHYGGGEEGGECEGIHFRVRLERMSLRLKC